MKSSVELRNPQFYITALFIFLVSIVIKAYFIADYSLWYDESVSLFNAQKNILRVLEYSALDNTPPIYNLFLFIWIKLFGISEFSVRFPSVIFSAITTVTLFYLGLRYKSYWTGIVAATVFTLNNFNLWYAQEARCYAMVAMFAVFSIIIFDNWQQDQSKKNTKWLIAINCILLYTHYITFFVFAGQALYILLYKKELFRYYFKLMLKVAMLFAIWSIALIRNLITINNGFWIPPTSSNTLGFFFRELSGSLLQFYFIITLLIGGFFLQKEEKKRYVFLTFSIVLPVLLLMLVSVVTPLFITRYIIYIFPITALLLAISSTSFGTNRWVNFTTGAILIIGLSYNSSIRQEKVEDMKSLVEKIKSVQGDNRTIILQTEVFYGLFTYYYNQEGLFEHPYEVHELMKKQKIIGLSAIDALDKNLIDKSQQVFLINMFNDYPDPEAKVKKYIQSNHPNNNFSKTYGGLTLSIFSK